MKNFVKGHFSAPPDPMGKMNGTGKIELCRRKAKKIMSTCKKYHSIFPPFFRVENPCGKTCGECGKLKVINRYFASLPFHSQGGSLIFGPISRLCSLPGFRFTSPELRQHFLSDFPEKVGVVSKLPGFWYDVSKRFR